jgi:NAD(P)-dependent dehydrogenase (short-subunit alcohol dehydrogenase family)
MSIVIIGAGPNLGAAIARRFGREGLPVEVLEYSPLPAKEFMKPILETTVDDVRGPLELSVLGAVAAVTTVVDGMLHDELRDRGVHVAHTAIGGRIAPGEAHEPDDVADVLWRHHTERGDFQTRLGID